MHWNLSAHTQRSPDIRKAYGSCQLQNQKLTGSMRAIRVLPSSFSSPALDLFLQLNVSKSGVIKWTLKKKKGKIARCLSGLFQRALEQIINFLALG